MHWLYGCSGTCTRCPPPPPWFHSVLLKVSLLRGRAGNPARCGIQESRRSIGCDGSPFYLFPLPRFALPFLVMKRFSALSHTYSFTCFLHLSALLLGGSLQFSCLPLLQLDSAMCRTCARGFWCFWLHENSPENAEQTATPKIRKHVADTIHKQVFPPHPLYMYVGTNQPLVEHINQAGLDCGLDSTRTSFEARLLFSESPCIFDRKRLVSCFCVCRAHACV